MKLPIVFYILEIHALFSNHRLYFPNIDLQHEVLVFSPH
jgi:hypothetical protein